MSDLGWILAISFVGAGLVAAGVCLHAYFSRSHRRERAFQTARAMLCRGEWEPARHLAMQLQAMKALDPTWAARTFELVGECWYVGAEQSLAAGRYSEAVERSVRAGERLGFTAEEARHRIVEAMLAVLRRMIVSKPADANIDVLVSELTTLKPENLESLFWMGFSQIHRGEFDHARESMTVVFDQGGKKSADAALYLGALAVRRGHHREAVRHLGAANRLAPNCPVVGWQLGLALLGEGGDPLLAVRALQKAVSANGLAAFRDDPARLWPESLPADSWLGRLSRRAAVSCPLGLDDVTNALTSARRHLGIGLLRANRPDDAAATFRQAVAAGDTDPVTLSGLGQALVQLGRYAEALPHLRAAELSGRPMSIAAQAALVLATAFAAKDVHAGVRAAVGLIVGRKHRDNDSWVDAVARIVAEARDQNLPLHPSELRELTAVFAAARATDPIAAAVYAQAEPTDDDTGAVAALYLKAAVDHDFRGQNDAAWLDHAFRHRERTRRWFEEWDWKFEPAERLYLTRWGERHSGGYPPAAGPEYAAIGEQVLLRQSRQAEARGRAAEARTLVDLALRLGPTRPAALDRAAELAYRAGDTDSAVKLLGEWLGHHPRDPRPLARLAMIDYLIGRPTEALAKLESALRIGCGNERFRLLLFGARFALAAGRPERAIELFTAAHRLDPHNAAPLAGLTCLHWLRGEMTALVPLARAWHDVRAEAPVFYFLAAVCHYLAGDCEVATAAVRHAAGEAELASESKYLQGLIHLRGKSPADASAAWRGAAAANQGTARDPALAQLGLLAWNDGDFAAAARHWRSITPERRVAWKLDRPLARATAAAGVAALRAAEFASAAEWFREARSHGADDPRLPAWLGYAQAGLARRATDPAMLAAIEAALPSPPPVQLTLELARAYRRLNQTDEARRLLDRAGSSAEIELQHGLCAVADQLYPAAERHFSHALKLDPSSVPAALNLLFTRWSLGQTGTAELLDRVLTMPVPPKLTRVLQLLRCLEPDGPRSTDWAALTDVEEARLIAWLKKLGNLDTVGPMLARLSGARPNSRNATRAVELVRALAVKSAIDRGDPWSALAVAAPVAENSPIRPALQNLIGIAHCLVQDYGRAVGCFQDALPDADDARLRQNLALALTWQGQDDLARIHWRRYLALAGSHCPGPPTESGYVRRLIELVRERMEAEPAAARRD